MIIIVSLGGNALLRRGEPMTAQHQRANIRHTTQAIAAMADAGHQVVLSHGNGPQVGLLALQAAAYQPGEAAPLDMLVAQTQGGIGYHIEQELGNALAGRRCIATLLTQAEVAADDPAFGDPTKPIGPLYSQSEAERMAAASSWTFKPEDGHYRRVVPSPRPRRIPELDVIRLLVEHGVIVICGGGGGIPVLRDASGELTGVEAVIDKDWTCAMLAEGLGADFLLLLTDVDAVYEDWGTPQSRPMRRAAAAELRERHFAEGSMGPKIDAACSFVEATGGRAGIGALRDALAILEGRAGTLVSR